MSALTQKQIKAREYYQRNKAKICEQKRNKYQSESSVSSSTKATHSNKQKEVISTSNLAIRLAFSAAARPRKVSDEDMRKGDRMRSIEQHKENLALNQELRWLEGMEL